MIEKSKTSTTRRRALAARPTAAFLALALTASTAQAADPGSICEARKLGTSAKYASCRLKAESKAAKAGTSADYSKCSLAKFGDAETKAEGACPTSGDQTTVKNYLDDCTSTAALWLGGGGGLPDTCDSDLVACEGDLSTTNADLTTCEGDLSTTNADLTTCEGDLAACEAAPGGLPRTGQTTSYGAGSDGAEQRGTARSFTDNGDGTITDNVTGLMWEKKSDDGSIHDWENTYTWSTGTNNMDGTMVTTFLATLNGGGGFAGYTDWRIPNVFELESLRNMEALTPAVYPAFHNACTVGCTVTTCSCTRASSYWSSTTVQDGPDSVWVTGFLGGGTALSGKTQVRFVRAVRGGS